MIARRLAPARYTLHIAPLRFYYSCVPASTRPPRSASLSWALSSQNLVISSFAPRMQDHPFATTPGLAPGLSHLFCSRPPFPTHLVSFIPVPSPSRLFDSCTLTSISSHPICRPYDSSKIWQNDGTHHGPLPGILPANGKGLECVGIHPKSL